MVAPLPISQPLFQVAKQFLIGNRCNVVVAQFVTLVFHSDASWPFGHIYFACRCLRTPAAGSPGVCYLGTSLHGLGLTRLWTMSISGIRIARPRVATRARLGCSLRPRRQSASFGDGAVGVALAVLPLVVASLQYHLIQGRTDDGREFGRGLRGHAVERGQFVPANWHMARRRDADPDAAAHDRHDRNHDVVADDDLFTSLARKQNILASFAETRLSEPF